MQYRNLGKSPLKVSALCLGTMTFAAQTDEAEAASIVAKAKEQGVNFMDTADVYSDGASEAMLGRLLAGQRDDWIVATKLGNSMGSMTGGKTMVNHGHYSRWWMVRQVEAGLKRLASEHIDILYLHRDYEGMDLEEPLRALDDLIRAGKLRYWGISNFRGWRISEVVHTARAIGMPAPVVCQPYYNLMNRGPETDILPACHHHGIGVVPYSPVARGVLTGKYLPGQEPPADTRAGRKDRRMMQTEFRAESLELAQKVVAHARAKGVSPVAFVTAWVMAHRAVSSVIAGPRTLAQWDEYAPALEVNITPEDEQAMDALVTPGHPSTPGFNDPAYPWWQGRPV